MKTLEESVVNAMDGSDTRLFPYLPYLVQDLWEIGADPDAVIRLISKQFHDRSDFSVLDLGCGKGPVAIRLAKQFGCRCHGIDALPEFIAFAEQKAREYGVAHRCTFEPGDIREKIKRLTAFDVIILGSIGPVLGDYFATLTSLSACLAESGIIVIADGYTEAGSSFPHPAVQTHEEMIRQIDAAGMQLTDLEIIQQDEMKKTNEFIYKQLKKRCTELIRQHPEQKMLFERYLEQQEAENEILENRITCATMVITRKR